MNDIYKKNIDTLGERVKRDVVLAPYTTFKIGGPADLFYEANTIEELVNVIDLSRKSNISFFILGGGTNILIGDKGFRGLVIKNSTSAITIRGVKGTVTDKNFKQVVYVQADSGVVFNKFVRFTIEEGLRGIEMHLGLPGTVGGALYMNSKWTKPVSCVGDAVYQAEILTPTFERKIVPQSYFHFGYDTSSIQTSLDIVLRVVFAFTRFPKEALWNTANESIIYRKETQPQGAKTAGCVFQNLSKAEALTSSTPNLTTSAGFLIDLLGLKGEKKGSAQISTIHANFIINTGEAKASDVLQLINLIKARVKSQFHVDLREEIRLVGEF